MRAPSGKFGTFGLSSKDLSRTESNLKVVLPTVFAIIDAYNGGSRPATIQIRSPQIREQSFTVQPGPLMRIRTGWHNPSTAIEWKFGNGEGLIFDNLAYTN
jgi:hypothetical protein